MFENQPEKIGKNDIIWFDWASTLRLSNESRIYTHTYANDSTVSAGITHTRTRESTMNRRRTQLIHVWIMVFYWIEYAGTATQHSFAWPTMLIWTIVEPSNIDCRPKWSFFFLGPYDVSVSCHSIPIVWLWYQLNSRGFIFDFLCNMLPRPQA